jgi:hypothetical protein
VAGSREYGDDSAGSVTTVSFKNESRLIKSTVCLRVPPNNF